MTTKRDELTTAEGVLRALNPDYTHETDETIRTCAPEYIETAAYIAECVRLRQAWDALEGQADDDLDIDLSASELCTLLRAAINGKEG